MNGKVVQQFKNKKCFDSANFKCVTMTIIKLSTKKSTNMYVNNSI